MQERKEVKEEGESGAQSAGKRETARDGGAGHKRARAMLGIMVIFVALGAAWGWWWYTTQRFVESTDDAYVAGNVLRIMPQINGKVMAVLVDDNEMVQAGQPLVTLDPIDVRLAYERALVALAAPVREIGRLQAELRQSEAAIAMRKVDLRQQLDNLSRREVLGQNKAIGQEELKHARDGVDTAEASLRSAVEQRNALAAMLSDSSLEEQPSVKAAAQQVRDAWIALQRTTVASPASGLVAKRSVQAGEVVSPGMPLLTVVPVDHLWVDANFKEMQLRRLRIGQKAEVRVDLYGDSVVYQGRVAGVSAGTGSVFSLLPAQNATGNWIKIVQRVPVRIELDPAELKAHPLLIGLSTLVVIDTRDDSGPLLAEAPRSSSLPDDLRSRAPEIDMAPAEAAIAEVIASNAPHPLEEAE